jgi:AmmeMemoRadiSam system protein B
MMFSEQVSKIRPPAVAGQFYPADPQQLQSMVQDMFSSARQTALPHVKALIVPHAGLIYSGPVAASAYRAIMKQAGQIKRVVLLGPSHRVGFHGIATISASEYRMPMGDIRIDQAAIQQISYLPQVVQLDEAHAAEHSLEVQLPFLQAVLDDFLLVPLVVGDCPSSQVAEVLDRLWGGEETLIVISSDLSHYNSYEVAQAQDQQTSQAILNLQPENIHYDDACGRNPVNGLLLAAQQHHLKPHLIDLRNSGDTAGSHDRVVGYGAYAFVDE